MPERSLPYAMGTASTDEDVGSTVHERWCQLGLAKAVVAQAIVGAAPVVWGCCTSQRQAVPFKQAVVVKLIGCKAAAVFVQLACAGVR